MAPRKRQIDEIGALLEPELSAQQRAALDEGMELYDAGHYWHAHEAWERAWLEMPDDERGDAEILLRGMIQLAAALHLKSVGRIEGATSNLRKAREKLALAPAHFMGIDFTLFHTSIAQLERDLSTIDGSGNESGAPIFEL